MTTLSMARLQERMLDVVPTLSADGSAKANFKQRYGDELGASCWAEFSQKRLDKAGAERLNDVLREKWDDIRQRVSRVLLPSRYLEDVLLRAGGEVLPKSIHLERDFYEMALLRAREIRNRYTFFDLSAQSGLLADAIPSL